MKTSLFLAQLYWKKEDPTQSTLILVIFGVLGLGLILYQVLKQGRGSQGQGGSAERGSGGASGGAAGGASSGARRGFSRASFKRSARAAGLAEDEIAFLADYGKALGLSNPEFVFGNRARLDSFLKEVFRTIEKNSESEAAAEESKAALFGIRERLARQSPGDRPLRSTRQLGSNLPISFITQAEENYPTVIVQAEAGGLAVEPVLDRLAQPIRFKRGSRLLCNFYSATHQGYQFETKVVGWERFGDKELMILQHNDDLRSLPTRQHQRKELDAPCSFYRLAVSTKMVGRSERAGARVEGQAYQGTIADISAGGASIRTANPLDVGEFLKLEFDPGSGIQAAFAKVVRTNARAGRGGVMHLRFVKISRKSLNAVLSYVHGYSE